LPRVDPGEYESLPLEAFRVVEGFVLHDVWLVELEGTAKCTVQDVRNLVTPERLGALSPVVRALFRFRSLLGRAFRLDSATGNVPARHLVERVPARLAGASRVDPGTWEGPFQALYVLPGEAAYQVLNATVHAIVVVALTGSAEGPRLFWATYVRPVGRITSIYMRVIDPFRRWVVYPGLESWLKRAWSENRGLTNSGRSPEPPADPG